MCFSANASFGASAILAVVGVVAIVRSATPAQRLFAATPLVFSIQQLSEGLLWVSLKQPGLIPWQPTFTYTFLVFAMIVWPVWIPLTIRQLEKDLQRRKILTILTALGISVSIVVAVVLLLFSVRAIPTHHHLHYQFEFSQVAKNLIGVFTVLYVFTSIVAPFVSEIKRMKWLGLGLTGSYIFSVIFYHDFVVSVWCYFAAVLSILILWIVLDLPESVDERFPQRHKGRQENR